MRRRNKLVYHLGKTRGIPIAVCLGGGYSVPIDASVQSHVDVFRDAAEVFDFHQF
jgi:acetoin utilization deacetylase AcuC-like enzyme